MLHGNVLSLRQGRTAYVTITYNWIRRTGQPTTAKKSMDSGFLFAAESGTPAQFLLARGVRAESGTGGRMSSKDTTKKFINDTIMKEISDAVASLDYGTVLINVHNKKITQIEIAEKKRFDDVWKIEEGGGI